MAHRVLIIEDDQEWRREIGNWLGWALGDPIIYSPDGSSLQQGMPLLRDEEWDLLVIDISLSGELDGRQFIKLAGRSPGEPAVLVISAMAFDVEPQFDLRGRRGPKSPLMPVQGLNPEGHVKALLLQHVPHRHDCIQKPAAPANLGDAGYRSEAWQQWLKQLVRKKGRGALLRPPYLIEVSGFCVLDPTRGLNQGLDSLSVWISENPSGGGRRRKVNLPVDWRGERILLHSIGFFHTASALSPDQRDQPAMHILEAGAMLELSDKRLAAAPTRQAFQNRVANARSQAVATPPEDLRAWGDRFRIPWERMIKLLQGVVSSPDELLSRGIGQGVRLGRGVRVRHTNPQLGKLKRQGVLAARQTLPEWHLGWPTFESSREAEGSTPPSGDWQRLLKAERKRWETELLDLLSRIPQHCTGCGQRQKEIDAGELEDWVFCPRCGARTGGTTCLRCEG